MMEKTTPIATIPFAQTQINVDKVQLGEYEATANRDDQNAPWNVDGHDNLQKIATEASAVSMPFDGAIEELKAQYEFYEGQDEDIIAVLSRYPFLIMDLNRIHEIKCQYFDDAPMSLYYISETGRLEDADLSAAVVFDDDLWDKKFDSSFDKFQEECWREISKEGDIFISVGFE
ncbi:MAG TPA: hypothetical protein VN207_07645 [Ktedonobacteraceae bacterium]|nr:hypothetical protein [Ktedonobacteraceae bacterium]